MKVKQGHTSRNNQRKCWCFSTPSHNYYRMGNQLQFHHPQTRSPTTSNYWSGVGGASHYYVTWQQRKRSLPGRDTAGCLYQLRPRESEGKEDVALSPLAATWWPGRPDLTQTFQAVQSHGNKDL
jgi:hypothetical protein